MTNPVNRDQGPFRGYEVVHYDESGQDLIDREDIDALRMQALSTGQPVPPVPSLPGVLPQPGLGRLPPTNGASVSAPVSAGLDKFLAVRQPTPQTQQTAPSRPQVVGHSSAVAYSTTLSDPRLAGNLDVRLLNKGLPTKPELADSSLEVGSPVSINPLLAQLRQAQQSAEQPAHVPSPEPTSTLAAKMAELEDPELVLAKIKKTNLRPGVIIATTSVGEFFYKPMGFRVLADLVALLFESPEAVPFTPKVGMLLYCTLRTEQGLELYGLYYSGIKLPSMYADAEHQILVFHRTEVHLLDDDGRGALVTEIFSPPPVVKPPVIVPEEEDALTLAINQAIADEEDGFEFDDDLVQDGTPDGIN